MAKGGDKFEGRYERKREENERYQESLPGKDDIPLPPPPETIRKEETKPRRNDPCPCGSGKKYKQCCLKTDQKKKK